MLERLESAVADSNSDEGISKSDIIDVLGYDGIAIDDELWRMAIQVLIDEGRVSKRGRGRGTRYHVVHPPPSRSPR